MAFTRIHHVGVVVADLDAARKLWVDTYGFKADESRSPLPHGRHVTLDNVNILDIPVGESELEINWPNDAESGTGRYLANRGAGLHHLGLYTDDIEEDVRRLEKGGLRTVVPPTGSSQQRGGQRVAFFHPKENLGFLLELWQDMPANGEPRRPVRGSGGGITRIHHVGFVAPDIGEALHLFCDVYGLEVDEAISPLPNGRTGNDNVRVFDIPVGESEIEVIVPQDTESGTARFLASRGPGMHHICFYSEDMEREMKRLRDAGLQEIGSVSRGRLRGESIGWLHPKSNMGVLVELWQDPAEG